MLPATVNRSSRLQVLLRITGLKIFEKFTRKYSSRNVILMKLQILNSLLHVLLPRGFSNISRTVISQNASTRLHLKALLGAKSKKNQAKLCLSFA